MLGIDIFYSTTTTALIVLSSATLLVFKYFIDSVQSAVKLCENSIRELDNKEKTGNKKVLDILGRNTETLSLKREILSTNIVWEYFALFAVILFSAISIFLVLLNGVFDLSITIKSILWINLLSIIMYVAAFISLVFRVQKKRKSLKMITAESKMFIKSIDDTDALYRIINQNKGNDNG